VHSVVAISRKVRARFRQKEAAQLKLAGQKKFREKPGGGIRIILWGNVGRAANSSCPNLERRGEGWSVGNQLGTRKNHQDTQSQKNAIKVEHAGLQLMKTGAVENTSAYFT